MNKIKINIILLFFCLLLQSAYGQKHLKSELDVNNKADDLFRKENYAEALPLYSQLLSLYPKDAVFSYKFGVCLLMADRRNTEMLLKYLEYALDKPGVDEDVYYFLGIAYHLNYRFAEAIKEYEIYRENVSERASRRNDIERRTEMCGNGMRLLKNVSDLYVLERKTVDSKDFYRSYNLGEFGGRFLAKPDMFKSKLDKKLKDNSIVFYSEKNNVVYFSSYGEEKGKNINRDIYRAYKLGNGEWAKPERLSNAINTQYDEDYPFILPDGNTLYFCSKGHNSMGGYDIFKSYCNQSNKTWSEPENLDFAINTPYDDILFVCDTNQINAYFSSTRNTTEGQLSVYKVRIDKKPKPELEAGLIMNTELSFTQKDSTYLKMIKRKASLEVNATEEMFDKPIPRVIASKLTLKQEIEDRKVFADTNKSESGIRNPEKIVTDTVSITKISSNHVNEDIAENIVAAEQISKEKKELAETKHLKADSLFLFAEKTSDASQKELVKEEGTQLKKEAEQLDIEAKIADNIAQQYESKGMENGEMTNNKEGKGNRDSITLAFSEPDKKQKNNKVTSKEKQREIEFVSKTDKEIKKVGEQTSKIQAEIEELKVEIDNYKSQIDKTKDKLLKDVFRGEIKESDSIINIKQKQLDLLNQKNNTLVQMLDSASNYQKLKAIVNKEIINLADKNIKKSEIEIVAENKKADNTNQIITNGIPENKQSLAGRKDKIQTDIKLSITKINDNSRKAELFSNSSIEIAVHKNKLATDKKKEADSIFAEVKNENNDFQKSDIEKVSKLEEEFAQLKSEAIVAYKVSEQLKHNINENKQLVKKLSENLQNISKVTEENNFNDIVSEIEKSKPEIELAEKPVIIEALANEEYDRITLQKENNAKEYAKNALRLQDERKTDIDESNKLTIQASNIKNDKQKRKILQRADSLMVASELKLDQVYINESIEKNITDQVKYIKSHSEQSQNLVYEINSGIVKADTSKATEEEKTILAKDLNEFESTDIYALNNNKLASVNKNKLKKESRKTPDDDMLVMLKAKLEEMKIIKKQLQNIADSLIQTSEMKNNEAENKGKEAQKQLAIANEDNNNKTKTIKIEKASKLKKDSANLVKEAMVSKNISEVFAQKAKEQQSIIDSVIPDIKIIEEYAINNDVNGLKNKIEETDRKINNKEFDTDIIQQDIASMVAEIAVIKGNNARAVLNEANELQQQLNKVNDEVLNLKNIAANSTSNSKKRKLQNQYLQKEQTAANLDREVKEKYRQGNQLKIEATAMKIQVAYAVNILKRSIELSKVNQIKQKEILANNSNTEEKPVESMTESAVNKTTTESVKDTSTVKFSKKESKIIDIKEFEKKDKIENDKLVNQTVSDSLLVLHSSQPAIQSESIKKENKTESEIVNNTETIPQKDEIKAEIAIDKTAIELTKDTTKAILTKEEPKISIINKLENKVNTSENKVVNQSEPDSLLVLKSSQPIINKETEKIKYKSSNKILNKNETLSQKDTIKSENNKSETPNAVNKVPIKSVKDTAEVENNTDLSHNKAINQSKFDSIYNKESSLIITDTKVNYDSLFALNQIKYNDIKSQAELTSPKNDTTENIKVAGKYVLEAVYYFNQAIITKKKADSTSNIKEKSKLIKDANSYTELAINNQEQAQSIYKSAKPELLTEKKFEEKTINVDSQSKIEFVQPVKPVTDKEILTSKDTITLGENNNPTEPETKTVPIEIVKNIKKDTSLSSEKTIQTSQDTVTFTIKNKPKNPEKRTVPIEIVKNIKKDTSLSSVKTIQTSQDTVTFTIKNKPKNPEKKTVPIEIVKNIRKDTIKFSKIITQNSSDTSAFTSINKKNEQRNDLLVKNDDLRFNIKDNKSELRNQIDTASIVNKVKTEDSSTELLPEKQGAGKKIDIINGLFYTVQIGVFGKPRTVAQLINLNPIFFDILSNGNYRYLSGVYDKKEDAILAKNAIVDMGIKDAFIVIYLNGKRITSSDALKLETQGTQLHANSIPVNINNVNIIGNSEISLRLQIGAYRRETDLTRKNNFLRTSSVAISNMKTQSGLILYFAGSFTDFESALELKKKIVDSGINDAFIIAIQNNKKLSITEARNKLRKL